MTTNEEILGKQLEILSHQKHFNLILTIATIFLVLIYALQGSSYFLKYSSVALDIIVGIMIIALVILTLFIIKQGYLKKLLRLFLGK